MTTKSGAFEMLIVGKAIVLLSRKRRSKWWEIECPGCSPSRRRTDGTCKHERTVLESVNPKIKQRVRIVTPEMSR